MSPVQTVVFFIYMVMYIYLLSLLPNTHNNEFRYSSAMITTQLLLWFGYAVAMATINQNFATKHTGKMARCGSWVMTLYQFKIDRVVEVESM